MYYYQNELTHSGRKGMKWGTRNGPPYPLSRQARFKDGFESYNKDVGDTKYKGASGRGRTTENAAKKVAKSIAKAPSSFLKYRRDQKQAKINRILERGSKRKILKNLKRMNNEELEVARKRLQLLKSVKDVNRGEKSAGYELANKGLDWLRLAKDYTSNASDIKKNIEKLTDADSNKVTKKYAKDAIAKIEKSFNKNGYKLDGNAVKDVEKFVGALNSLENFANGKVKNNDKGNDNVTKELVDKLTNLISGGKQDDKQGDKSGSKDNGKQGDKSGKPNDKPNDKSGGKDGGKQNDKQGKSGKLKDKSDSHSTDQTPKPTADQSSSESSDDTTKGKPKGMVTRVKVYSDFAAHKSNKQIAEENGLTMKAVKELRKKWNEQHGNH